MTSRQNRKPHGKTKNLTSKPNTVRYFVFAVRFLVLPWCFSFAVRFLVLPRQLWATRLLCSWENLTKWTLLAQEPLPCRLSDRLDTYFWGEDPYHLRKCQTRQVLARIWRKKTIISSLPNDQSGRPVLTHYSLRGRRSKGKGRLDFLLIRLHRFKNRRWFRGDFIGIFQSLNMQRFPERIWCRHSPVKVACKKQPFLLVSRRWGRFVSSPAASSEEKPTFSTGRFSLALEVGREKAREKRPGDEVEEKRLFCRLPRQR